jgi:K+ transporter
MHPDQRLRKAVKWFYAYIGSVLAAGAGPIIAMQLVHRDSTVLRAAGVAVGVGAWIPLVLLTLALIRASDELAQRIHLLAASLAFVGGLFLIALVDWLVRAGFVEPVPYTALWLALAAFWAISLFVAKRRVERGSSSKGRRP